MDSMDRDCRPPQEQEETRLASLFLRSTFIASSARFLGGDADSWVRLYPLRSKSICGVASVRTLWHCALHERDYIVHAWTRRRNPGDDAVACYHRDRKSTRLELQSHLNLVCRLLLEKKKYTEASAGCQLPHEPKPAPSARSPQRHQGAQPH